MAESPKYEANQFPSKHTSNTTATIKQVVLHYTALDEHGNPKDFFVEFDPGKYGAVVWNVEDKKKFLKGKTDEEPPLPGELPVPKSKKLLEKDDAEEGVPNGTCCFINGRWVCWS